MIYWTSRKMPMNCSAKSEIVPIKRPSSGWAPVSYTHLQNSGQEPLGDRSRKFKLQFIVAHGGRDGTMLLEPVFRHCHQVRRVGALIQISKGQVGEYLPGVLDRSFGQNKRIGHLAIRIPIAGEAVIVIAALHLSLIHILPPWIMSRNFRTASARYS